MKKLEKYKLKIIIQNLSLIKNNYFKLKKKKRKLFKENEEFCDKKQILILKI